MSESPQEPNGPQTASPAGIYDYLLGGDACTAADREAASRIIAALPVIPQVAWANRGFLMRAVTWMARERGIRQTMAHPEVGDYVMSGWPVRFGGKTAPVKPAPLLGQHSEEVLAEWLKLPADEIDNLKKQAVVG